jgi:hypothetical protein
LENDYKLILRHVIDNLEKEYIVEEVTDSEEFQNLSSDESEYETSISKNVKHKSNSLSDRIIFQRTISKLSSQGW